MRTFALVLAILGVVAACKKHRPADNGDTGIPTCMPEGAHQCLGSTWQACMGGQWVTAVDCPYACADMIGCVACQPGNTYCNGNAVTQCDMNGNPGTVVQTCPPQDTCSNAACVDACADAAANRSYIGCEYWAVDLDNAIEVVGPPIAGGCLGYPFSGLSVENVNACVKSSNPRAGSFAGGCDPPATAGGAPQCPAGYACQTNVPACVLDALHAPFSIAVSNPQVNPAHVTLTVATGQSITATIPPGQVMPLLPQMGGAIPSEAADGSIQAKLAYKLTSDLPVVAYQFTPLDNSTNAFSNDASLLIPRTAFDVDYYVLAWPTLGRRTPAPGTNDYHGYFAVVAWQDNTVIQVTTTAAVDASATQASIAANTPTMFTLNAFDVLQLEASGPAGDLTGSTVTSMNGNTFGVFEGHEATAFGETTPPDATHTQGPCCADQLSEMLYPKSTWGKTFAITRSVQRTNEPDYLRIVAQKPNTSVTFDPAPAALVAGNCAMLQPGQFCDVKIQVDTGITSTQPILVGHFLEATIWSNTQRTSVVGTGDPADAIAVPVEQYRTDYTVLIPNTYSANYLSISAAPTGGVLVDGQQISGLTSYASNTHRAARVPVMPGSHTIHCPDNCGVMVYGYGNAIGYMYAGGLDLKQIVIQ